MDFHNINLHFPLENPTLIFAVVLLVILFSPLLLQRLRIPYIVGLIAAGVLLGPKGFDLLPNDESFKLFGNVGILYILFLAGLDMDMNDFRQNRGKGLLFGLFTFSIPLGIGFITSYYLLHFSILASVFVASMYSTQTLVAYPIVSRYGVTKNRAVTITVSGTILTDTMMLITIAIIAALSKGTMDRLFMLIWAAKIAVFGLLVIGLFPILTRLFMKKIEDSILQFIFVLAMVFLGAFLAQLAGLEGVLGAFLVGVSLNRLIPNVSPLKNRLEFVGNAFFIPFFLIGVGMLIDYRVLFNGYEALTVALVMAIVAITSKWLAAMLTRVSLRLSKEEGKMIFGLSSAHAAAILAGVMVGYNIIIGQLPDGSPVRLINAHVLNGTILVILFSSIISSFITEKAARRLALKARDQEIDSLQKTKRERVLISLSNPDTVERLVELALMIQQAPLHNDLCALTVVSDTTGSGNKSELLERASKIASSSEQHIESLIRFDVNISSGIIHTAIEQNCTDILIGLHQKSKLSDSFLGLMGETLRSATNRTLMIYKPSQPLSTISRILIFMPVNAELEAGFIRNCTHFLTLANQAGASMIVHSTNETFKAVNTLAGERHASLAILHRAMNTWEELPKRLHHVRNNDFIIFVLARKSTLSYQPLFDELPHLLTQYLFHNSYMLTFPEQFGDSPAPDESFHSLRTLMPQLEDITQPIQWGKKLWQKRNPDEGENA
jgi:Kef-type K+ transport system membrane component KefB